MEILNTHSTKFPCSIRVVCVLGLTIVLLTLLHGCSIQKTPAQQPGKSDYRRIGIASYYGKKFHHRKTASGEIFNNNLMTAAHRTLPFGTNVVVTNLANGKSVKVRINDRGPFIKKRIIDLSRAAFRKIENLRKGVVRVEIRVVD